MLWLFPPPPLLCEITMPAYEYECKACGHKFEATHGMNEAGPKACPECKRRQLAKVIGMPAFHAHYSPMHPRAGRGRGRGR